MINIIKKHQLEKKAYPSVNAMLANTKDKIEEVKKIINNLEAILIQWGGSPTNDTVEIVRQYTSLLTNLETVHRISFLSLSLSLLSILSFSSLSPLHLSHSLVPSLLFVYILSPRFSLLFLSSFLSSILRRYQAYKHAFPSNLQVTQLPKDESIVFGFVTRHTMYLVLYSRDYLSQNQMASFLQQNVCSSRSVDWNAFAKGLSFNNIIFVVFIFIFFDINNYLALIFSDNTVQPEVPSMGIFFFFFLFLFIYCYY